jgi:hypothetical protein
MGSFKYKNWYCRWNACERLFYLYTPEEMEQPAGCRYHEMECETAARGDGRAGETVSLLPAVCAVFAAGGTEYAAGAAHSQGGDGKGGKEYEVISDE